jgi:hypothetical protein
MFLMLFYVAPFLHCQVLAVSTKLGNVYFYQEEVSKKLETSVQKLLFRNFCSETSVQKLLFRNFCSETSVILSLPCSVPKKFACSICTGTVFLSSGRSARRFDVPVYFIFFVLPLFSQGERLPTDPIQRKSEAVVLQWSPKGRILASGWKDGTVALWSVDDGPKRENNSIHRSDISLLQWSPQGHRLVSGDENGVFTIFKTDRHGQLTLLCTHRKQGALRHCVFCLPPSQSTGDAGGRGELQQMTSSFFLGGDKGVVTFATDMGHNADVQQLRDSIDAMEIYAERNRLIIITKSYLMIQAYLFILISEPTLLPARFLFEHTHTTHTTQTDALLFSSHLALLLFLVFFCAVQLSIDAEGMVTQQVCFSSTHSWQSIE